MSTQELDGMTQSKWEKMTISQKEAIKDLSGLSDQLKGLEGCRVEVITTDGEKRRFIVGISTGWKPSHLEVKTRRSMAGDCAEKTYKSVYIIEKAR